jgi:hypothetical protein
MTYRELKAIGQDLLNEYTLRKCIDATEHEFYLADFQAIHRTYGGGKMGTAMAIVDEGDQESFRKIKEQNSITIYRGYRDCRKRLGISWSLSRKAAEAFACSDYFGLNKGFEPKLLQGTCLVKNILAYTNQRQEQEIIVNPAKIKNIREIAMSGEAIAMGTEETVEVLLTLAA